MGIFTVLSSDDIQTILHAYGLTLHRADGVSAGTVNTYYKVDTDHGIFYLRLDERGDETAVRQELELLAYLSHLSVPHPIPTRSGETHLHWYAKPAILFTPVPGHSVGSQDLQLSQFKEIGQWLAQFHSIAIPSTFFPHRFNPSHLVTVYTGIQHEIPSLSHPAAQLLSDAWKKNWSTIFDPLPQSLIHADLFEENLLFSDAKLSGVLDFEAAGRGPRLLDLAITIQALCFNLTTKQFNLDMATALAQAYCAHLSLTPAERQAWSDILLYSVIRFLITRIKDFELSEHKDKQNVLKDYREYLDHFHALPSLYSLLSS